MSDPQPVSAAGGVVFRITENGPEVLLIRRNGLWDLPKGKHEPGESVQQCAVREVAEETGGTLPVLLAPLGTTYHTYMEKGRLIGKTTWWYAMVFPFTGDLKPQLEEGITALEWIPFQQAIGEVGYENLKEVLMRFGEWFNRNE